jgi:hypothetical protein
MEDPDDHKLEVNKYLFNFNKIIDKDGDIIVRVDSRMKEEARRVVLKYTQLLADKGSTRSAIRALWQTNEYLSLQAVTDYANPQLERPRPHPDHGWIPHWEGEEVEKWGDRQSRDLVGVRASALNKFLADTAKELGLTVPPLVPDLSPSR